MSRQLALSSNFAKRSKSSDMQMCSLRVKCATTSVAQEQETATEARGFSQTNIWRKVTYFSYFSPLVCQWDDSVQGFLKVYQWLINQCTHRPPIIPGVFVIRLQNGLKSIGKVVRVASNEQAMEWWMLKNCLWEDCQKSCHTNWNIWIWITATFHSYTSVSTLT